MKWTVKHSLTATLLYASLFEYPLTEDELFRWSITSRPQPYTTSVLPSIVRKGSYIALKGTERYIPLREKREKISAQKWQIAKRNIRWLGYIPTILCVGVSGGLSMNNVDEDDDIDLFIITEQGALWISRLLVLFVLELLGKRRRYGQTYEKDFLCPNMFVTEAQLTVPFKEQDIYSAHEVLQMIPVFVRGNSYLQFLNANQWVGGYLMNAWQEKIENVASRMISKDYASKGLLLFIRLFESLAKWCQLKLMEHHRTNEVISDTMLRFHPHDTRQSIKKRYPGLLIRHKVPLDSKFFKQLQ